MADELKEPRKRIVVTGKDIALLICIIVLFSSIFVSMILDSQRQIAEKQYLASITPAEREHLQALQEQKDAAAVEGSKQFWNGIGSVLSFPMPFGFLVIIFSVLWFSMGRRHRWA